MIQVIQRLWHTDGPFEWEGKFYNISLHATEPVKLYRQNGGPLMYFGGGGSLCQALRCLPLWPETEDRVAETMKTMSEKAIACGRQIDFRFRFHVIVRETGAEARAAVDRLISRLDLAMGAEIKIHLQDSQSHSVKRQDELRAQCKGALH